MNEHRKHHEKFMLSKAYIQGYICIKITLASRHQHMKSDSRKLHINKNKNDSHLIVVFQYLHKRSIVKIGWISRSIHFNLDTLDMCSSSSMYLLVICINLKIYNATFNTWCAYPLYIKNLAIYSILCFFDPPILHLTIVRENEWINYELIMN